MNTQDWVVAYDKRGDFFVMPLDEALMQNFTAAASSCRKAAGGLTIFYIGPEQECREALGEFAAGSGQDSDQNLSVFRDRFPDYF